MEKALGERFRFVTDPLNSDFDCIYIAATFLTLAYRGLLNTFQIEQAKEFLLDLMKEGEDADESANPQNASANPQNDAQERQFVDDNNDAEQPPTKRFKHLNRVSELLRDREKEMEEEDSHELSNGEEELEKYSSHKANADDIQLDPLIFWANASKGYPALSQVACDILSTPASSAPIERTFSISGDASRGRRNRLADYNLERETLLRKNKKFL